MISLYVRMYVRTGTSDFSTKQDLFLKIEESCHLQSKMPKQMPFEF